jgi:membrane-associated phospholipid phosphatase
MRAPTGSGFALSSPAAWLVPLLALLGLVALIASGVNQRVFLALNAIGPATSDALWANITVLGDTAVALALCLLLWRRRPDLIWALAIGGVFAAAWVHGLKPLFDMPRPPALLGDAVNLIGPVYTVRAFPSGHATTSFFIGGLFALGLGSRFGYAAALAMALAAAVSRSVVGAHWPIDLLGGAFGGWLAAMAALALARRFPAPGRTPWIQWGLGLLLAGCAVALVAGHDGGYPQASWFTRGIGVIALAAAAAALWKDRRRWR